MAAGFPQREHMRKQDREAKGKNHSTLCNLILEVTFHFYCYVLFVRNDSKFQPTLQRKETTKGCNYQEAEITRALLEAVYHISHAPN